MDDVYGVYGGSRCERGRWCVRAFVWCESVVGACVRRGCVVGACVWAVCEWCVLVCERKTERKVWCGCGVWCV